MWIKIPMGTSAGGGPFFYRFDTETIVCIEGPYSTPASTEAREYMRICLQGGHCVTVWLTEIQWYLDLVDQPFEPDLGRSFMRAAGYTGPLT